VFRNDHKQYAIFWFTMAFILLGFYIVWQRSLTKEKKHAGV
jgi:cytochrome oxidase assembly protein ShyY1